MPGQCFKKLSRMLKTALLGHRSTIFIENNNYVNKDEAFKISDGKTVFYKCIVYTCFVYYIKLNHHLKNS